MTIRTKTWLPSRMSKSYGFYPTTKYVGQVFAADGKLLGETGKCGTRPAAVKAAIALRTKLNQGA